MSEAGQRGRVVRALKTLHGLPVENPVQPGTPDVNYIDGWIELKWLRRWPKGDTTLVRIPHFTPGQRRWLRKRWRLGGAAWLLLQVGKEWLLFNGVTAHDLVGLTTRAELYAVCDHRWENGLNDKELRKWLRRD